VTNKPKQGGHSGFKLKRQLFREISAKENNKVVLILQREFEKKYLIVVEITESRH
jgi:hypothetical protein